MSVPSLFLGQTGLYQFIFQQKDKRFDKLKSKVNFSGLKEKFFVSRDCYWEKVVYYPTGNLFELYKIINSEIIDISPINGNTSAYIINISAQRSIILYCCFTVETCERMKQLGIWYFIPETLAYYRALHENIGCYLCKNSLSPLNGDNISEDIISNEVVIKVENDDLSSLSLNSKAGLRIVAPIFELSSEILTEELRHIICKRGMYDVIDFSAQLIVLAREKISGKKPILKNILLFSITALFTFVFGKSVFLNWEYEKLQQEISANRDKAAKAIQLSNQLKNAKLGFEKINQTINEHSSKVKILEILSQISNQDEKLIFQSINILPSEIQLQGIAFSSTELLTLLSKVKGFNSVAFSSPPVAIKEQGERFNISLLYDEKIYVDTYRK
ncbi:hypothetical protein tinsulaeT_09250 [Thalassotalea insulae]|uniref:Uncharacterized protein n=1 Tax=Thalassotalea insulae TaxID=2056778 RepID=A0ABQ6GSC1_9GAMM|nr:hypothetical protein [Thalassotalea insulae]GLX77585.1 hypothetical protein tinsulaeT_09250 [Thalassotalea insulae]